MIYVTRFDGSKFVVNALMIEFVESTPDTVISLTNGKKIIVKETVKEIVDETADYLKRIGVSGLPVDYSELNKQSEKEG